MDKLDKDFCCEICLICFFILIPIIAVISVIIVLATTVPYVHDWDLDDSSEEFFG